MHTDDATQVWIAFAEEVSIVVIGLDNPRSAMAYGGTMGRAGGVAGGIAVTDPRRVPRGALTATVHTGIGCRVGPLLLFRIVRALVG